MVTFTKLNAMLLKIEVSQSYKKEGTPGRHEPPLYKNEPPRFARQTEPQLCSNEHAEYIKMCLYNTGGFLDMCFKLK